MTDLVEAVAWVLWEAQCDHWGKYRDDVQELCTWGELSPSKQRELMREARAVIPVVLERAAKVAEDAVLGEDYYSDRRSAAEDIAAAIRGLGEP